jgi:uncharacterized ion transporter superfamily protein YfcC
MSFKDKSLKAQQKEILVERFSNDIRNSIRKELQQDVEKTAKKQLMDEFKELRNRIKRKQILLLIAETVFLSAIIGLVVNQFTNALEGIAQSYRAATIIIMLLILTIYIFALYVGKLEEFLTQKELDKFSKED